MHHERFLEENKISESVFNDPFQLKMWHHKFDLHSVPPIEPAPIRPQPVKTGSFHRSESVKDFIDRTKLDAKVIDKRAQSPVADDASLAKMSSKTGLSIETLRLIK